jgi:hypothetical protein
MVVGARREEVRVEEQNGIVEDGVSGYGGLIKGAQERVAHL